MRVDIHPEEKLTGVELILTRLHAGGKFSDKNYTFSGGLHGVGVSVVNALSSLLIVTVRRAGKIYEMSFKEGDKKTELKVIGSCGLKETGTAIHFWPHEKYFDTPKFLPNKLKQTLQAKAVLCPDLTVHFQDENTQENITWHYENGLRDYLLENLQQAEFIPAEPFEGDLKGTREQVTWGVVWVPETTELIQESYVNLIPTTQGGTHVNGMRLT